MKEVRDYSSGLLVDTPMHYEYLRWLGANPSGVVLSLNRDRNGKYTVHRADCPTLSYDLVAKGQRHRTGKMCAYDPHLSPVLRSNPTGKWDRAGVLLAQADR